MLKNPLKVDKKICKKCPRAYTLDWFNHIETGKPLNELWWCACVTDTKISGEITIMDGRELPKNCIMKLEVLLEQTK